MRLFFFLSVYNETIRFILFIWGKWVKIQKLCVDQQFYYLQPGLNTGSY